ncbi:MAG: hypothetical protein RL112_1963 [Planctomycetota bacterium]|jgi:hypothetical protein
MKIRITQILLAACACLFPATAEAQNQLSTTVQLVDKTWTKTYGTSVAGGDFRVEASAFGAYNVLNGSGEATVHGLLQKRVQIFGEHFTAARLIAEAGVERQMGQTQRYYAYRVLLVGGLITHNEFDPEITFTIPPISIIPGDGLLAAVPVGPFQVAVRANAGLNTGMAIGTNIGVLPPTVHMTGTARASAVGVASAALHLGSLASCGVEAQLQMGNLATAYNLRPTFTTVSGTISLTMQAVILRLVAFAQIYIPIVGTQRWDETLAEWTTPKLVFNLPLD